MNNDLISFIKGDSYNNFSEFMLIDVSHDLVVFYENNGIDIVENSRSSFFDFVSKLTALLHQDDLSSYFDNLSVNKIQQNGGKISFSYRFKETENIYSNYLSYAKLVSSNGDNIIIVSTLKINYSSNNSGNQNDSFDKLEAISNSVSDVILKIYNVMDNTTEKNSTNQYITNLLDNLIREYPEFNKQFEKNITEQVNKVSNAILIVDDDAITRNLLKKCFADKYEIVTATNGEEAVEYLEQNGITNIVGMFLDLLMPVMDGFGVLEYLKKQRIISKIPIIIISGAEEKETRQRVYQYNIADLLEKPFNLEVIKYRTNNLINLYKTSDSLNNMMLSQYTDLRSIVKELVEAYKYDNKDKITQLKRYVGVFLGELRDKYPEYKLNDYSISKIIESVELYDVGMYAIPRTLGNGGTFTDADKEILKKQPIIGKTIVENYIDKTIDGDIYNYSIEITSFCHEKFNGLGFPYGMKEEQIPISAQVVSICSVLQMLINNQSLKNAGLEELLSRYIEIPAFNPKLIEILKEKFDLIKTL